MVGFKPIFSLSSFTFTKKLFSPSLSAIRVVSSVCLRLLIFLLAIFIPAFVSSSPAFPMMYSAYKLNKQGDNTQTIHVLLFLFETSLLFHVEFYLLLPDLHTDFLRGRSSVWYSYLFQNFPQIIVIHSQRLWHSQ